MLKAETGSGLLKEASMRLGSCKLFGRTSRDVEQAEEPKGARWSGCGGTTACWRVTKHFVGADGPGVKETLVDHRCRYQTQLLPRDTASYAVG